MTDAEWHRDPLAKQWIEHIMGDMVPKMEGSALVCSILPHDREGDVKFWVELGASIMLDKPIVIVAFDDDEIPERLRRVADEVVVCPEGVSPESTDELAAAFKRVLGE